MHFRKPYEIAVFHIRVHYKCSFLSCSLIVMDYDEFSKDDLIGSTRMKLYEVLSSPQRKISLRRLLDDQSVSHHHMIVTCSPHKVISVMWLSHDCFHNYRYLWNGPRIRREARFAWQPPTTQRNKCLWYTLARPPTCIHSHLREAVTRTLNGMYAQAEVHM